MAVENLSSLQEVNRAAGKTTYSYQGFGRLRVLRSSPPVVGSYGSGDANSTIALCHLPAGKFVLLGHLCTVRHSAFGTGRTLDIGWDAYTTQAGVAVAADEDGVHSAADVAAAGSFVPLDELGVSSMKLFDSREGVTFRAKVEAAGLSSGETLDMILVFQE
jgi:hypothetical protein